MTRLLPFLLTGAILAVSACSHQNTALDKAPGQYTTKTSATDATGTSTDSKTTTTVGYDANGNKEAVVKKQDAVDPPGLFNKSTSTSTQVEK